MRLALAHAPFEERAESDRFGEGHAFLEGGEGAAVEQVGGVHRVTGSAQLIGEANDSRGETLNVVEQNDLGQYLHLPSGCDY